MCLIINGSLVNYSFSQEKLCEILTLNDDISFGEKPFEKYYHFGLIFRRIPQVERL